jgi:hypothetical protein
MLLYIDEYFRGSNDEAQSELMDIKYTHDNLPINKDIDIHAAITF